MYFSYSNNETCLMAVIYLFFSWIAHAIRCEQWSREKEIQFMWFYRFSRSQFSFLISLIFSSVVFFFPSNDNFLKIYTSSYGPQHSLVFHLLTMVYKQLNGHFKCFINIALKQQQKKMHIRSLSFIHSCVSNARRKKKQTMAARNHQDFLNALIRMNMENDIIIMNELYAKMDCVIFDCCTNYIGGMVTIDKSTCCFDIIFITFLKTNPIQITNHQL